VDGVTVGWRSYLCRFGTCCDGDNGALMCTHRPSVYCGDGTLLYVHVRYLFARLVPHLPSLQVSQKLRLRLVVGGS
jgi:hypothetical protein